MANSLIAVPFDSEISKYDGKWAARFLMVKVPDDGHAPYVSAECMSAPLFDSQFAAGEAAKRAAKHYMETGMFPNMCEPF